MEKFGPKDVELNCGLAGAFGNPEIEANACRLIMFLALTGNKWHFSFPVAAQYYHSHGWDAVTMLYGLMGSWIDNSEFILHPDPGYITQDNGGLFAVTNLFRERVSKYVRRKKINASSI